MNLQKIETIVLQNIGYDRYTTLSAITDTTDEKYQDFQLIHSCVNLAREEIKLATHMPELMSIGTVIPTVAGNSGYSMATNFDVPVKIFYMDLSLNIIELTQAYVENIAESLLTSTTGTPSNYAIVGTSGDLIQLYLLPTPTNAGESILPIYKPVLTELSLNTDEDVIMRKYPKAVIDFATAFAWQLIKKDSAQHDKYYILGQGECKRINLREASFDRTSVINVETLLAKRRQDRLTI